LWFEQAGYFQWGGSHSSLVPDQVRRMKLERLLRPPLTVEWEAMQACLQTLFDGHPPPERFARRCLAAYLQSPWMSLIWPYFLEQKRSSHDIVRDLTKYLFTPHVFGSPD
jgi:hypothetical protein